MRVFFELGGFVLKGHYTFLIIPHGHQNYRKFRVRRELVWASITTIVLLFLTTGFLSYQYINLIQKKSELFHLREEAEQLKTENINFDRSISHLSQQLLHYEQTSKKLAMMIGVEELPLMVSEHGSGGIVSEGPLNDSTRLIEDELTALENWSSTLDKRFETLTDAYDEKLSVLQASPSIWPTRGFLTHSYGWRKDPFTGKRDFHRAIDISSRAGQEVVATADGTVVFSGWRRGYGNLVVISHGFGKTTKYAHLSKIKAQVGYRMRRGEIIGYVGSTGRSTAPHLHYEVIVDGRAANPLSYIVEDLPF